MYSIADRVRLTLHVGLNLLVGELASDEALGVEDGVVL
jgi:hypothetical protein